MSPTSANQPLPQGFRLEQRYRVARLIASGGFSMVYLAHDDAGFPVAIKEYLPHGLALRAGKAPQPVVSEEQRALFDEGLKCFFEEGCKLALLEHRNVVRVIDFFRANGTAYLVMLLERGRTLGEHVRSLKRGLDENTLRRVFVELLDGLHEVHSHGLLHLDIKPANIFLRSDLSPVLLDFGAAREIIGRDEAGLTPIHTPGYSAPEQNVRQGQLGHWTDIYGVGASLYFCLGGVAPHGADRSAESDAVMPAMIRWRGRYSDELLETVDRCMRADPSQRPQSASALQRELALLPDRPWLQGFKRRIAKLMPR